MGNIRLWTSCLEEVMREYSKYSTIYRMVGLSLSNTIHRIENIKRGWETWCQNIPQGLTYHGLDRGRIYDMMSEDYLSGRELYYVWLLANDASVTVEIEHNRLTTTLQGDTEGRYNISLHDMGGEVVLTYGNNLDGNKRTQRVDDYVASICEPSFEDLECDKD